MRNCARPQRSLKLFNHVLFQLQVHPLLTQMTPTTLPLVSQTQSDDEDYPPSDDDLHDQMAKCDGIGDFDSMATALNISLEDGMIHPILLN